MISAQEALDILDGAEQICPAEEVAAAVRRMAGEIGASLGQSYPLVLSVMGGAVVFSGQLLPLLHFPLDFDYIHASRYGNETQGNTLQWKVMPKENVAGRVVLVLDDILDEGHTMAAIREKILGLGAKSFHSAVFADKELGREKPVQADFIGINLPNRYVFGFGMDVRGAWRNLPAIYALKEEQG
ncbi:MAG: hypoxanthine-guanine phosphoribosyltransferase [Betaproteobacteria bacterium CG2_30_59_46]|nr:MAG: hypoxanthine-guanine phosphoribosyltransferase [Betaproteobacteria bacterium CG2_30_59_46]PIQ12049.1 MAG: hypoxanthine-guanine phosphoribosyltransferase [Hydrogenophilales bacterium CG18_big_fil_WC_8_21_14_2_50_58_12]PIX99695.1 MAG: hypoxanthine-guanine phosphoribosyltransferase [Hydrogenophilales bacterium CG_4_10_14_3_um_filter_58_23]PJB03874.1 MAG: hypoxanthine-guanine phosphoribosyltransferase [Hydrogenophilales bacterium CG_4_9_14_3_um_filter_59_35]